MWLSLVFGAVGTVLVLGLFSWLPFCRRRRRISELAELLPGPKPWPLLGDAHLFFGLSPAEACLMMGQLAEKYGDTFKLRLGPCFSVMFFHPSDVEQVLSSTQLVDKADEYDFLARWLNEGLLVSTGRKWHKRRKIITPAFHFRILEQYVEIFDRQTHQFLSNLDLARGKDDNLVNLGHAVHLCALDVICDWDD
ncbi:GL20342 [Drosophila persimilis]|uniref:GL20342 n=1 Tax=Drosophila persimilis TaxID=7234 RepID=B4GXS3_DROPE|nr:GL20342 [Drosophila persimilis]